jgi:diacylglycerol kinase (ATP)
MRPIFRNIFKFHGFVESLKIAAKGIVYLFLYHRNMRIIFMLGIAAFLLGLYLELKGIELVALCITIAIVFVAEIFNTAIELIIDEFKSREDTRIKLVKDIAAAVVLLASLNALAVGYILFAKKLLTKFLSCS